MGYFGSGRLVIVYWDCRIWAGTTPVYRLGGLVADFPPCLYQTPMEQCASRMWSSRLHVALDGLVGLCRVFGSANRRDWVASRTDFLHDAIRFCDYHALCRLLQNRSWLFAWKRNGVWAGKSYLGISLEVFFEKELRRILSQPDERSGRQHGNSFGHSPSGARSPEPDCRSNTGQPKFPLRFIFYPLRPACLVNGPAAGRFSARGSGGRKER